MADLYHVLEIPPWATNVDIKRAYRQAVLRYHPDHNPGNERAAETLFVEVQRAYRILADTAKRAEYDSHFTSPSEPDCQEPRQPFLRFRNVATHGTVAKSGDWLKRPRNEVDTDIIRAVWPCVEAAIGTRFIYEIGHMRQLWPPVESFEEPELPAGWYIMAEVVGEKLRYRLWRGCPRPAEAGMQDTAPIHCEAFTCGGLPHCEMKYNLEAVIKTDSLRKASHFGDADSLVRCIACAWLERRND